MGLLKNERIPLSGGVVDINNTGAKTTIAIPFRCRVVRFALTCLGTDANDATIVLDAVVNGTASAAAATISKPASNCQGKLLYDDGLRDTMVNPGDYYTVNVTAENLNSAQNAIPMLLVEEVPEEDNNLSRIVSA